MDRVLWQVFREKSRVVADSVNHGVYGALNRTVYRALNRAVEREVRK